MEKYQENPQTKTPQTVVFSPRDHETWREFYHRHALTMEKHRHLIHPCYLKNLWVLERFKNHVPSLREINEVLADFGWSAQYVHGYHPPWKVFRMLHAQIMPLSSSIRPAHEVGFAREPDMIHDIFGHLPSLMEPEYRKLLARWSKLAQSQPRSAIDRTLYHLNKTIVQNRASYDETEVLKRMARELAQLDHLRLSPLQVVDKLYFWIFEFGIIQKPEGLQVLGAGLLSSLDELSSLQARQGEGLQRGAFGGDNTGPSILKPLSLKTLCQPYSISDSQGAYATVKSLGMYDALITASAHMLSTGKRRRVMETNQTCGVSRGRQEAGVGVETREGALFERNLGDKNLLKGGFPKGEVPYVS